MFAVRLLLLMLLSSLSLSSPVLAAPYFVHCFDFGCKTTKQFRFEADQWAEVEAVFDEDVVDSASEKQAIRRAVAIMEKISGDLTDTHLDKGGNYPGSDIPGQMDCIDESTNTFQYLAALQEFDLMQWHQVDLKQRRIVWFATHWTASIREIESGQRFAVDSWYRDNGELPYIQPIADWQRKRDFPSDFNPELAANQ